MDVPNSFEAGTPPHAVASHEETLRHGQNARALANLAVAERYVALYNTDPERFVRECYHADYQVGAMDLGWYHGVDKFIAVGKAVLKAAPLRKMRVDCMHATDTTVVVEAVVTDSSRGVNCELPFCAALEIRGDKIAIDRTYAEFNKWPGLDGTV